MLRIMVTAASAAVFAALWHAAGVLLNSELILPFPFTVVKRLAALAVTLPFWLGILESLMRTLTAFVISAVLSLGIGTLMGISSAWDAFFRFPLSILKATPAVSVILLSMFWFTSSQVPVFVAVLMTMPVLTNSVAGGIRETDRKLLAMAQVYGFSRKQKVRHIYLPSMMPWFFSGAEAALGLSWKAVVAGEVLSLPRGSVGSALQTAKVHLDTADVFAWTAAVILCSYITERLFVYCTRPLRRRGEPDRY